ncbi:GGDEF domain-containing protein [Candidatus Symbiobacter mobilis]|uniref:diguanylate cyclase n=1 Tax=Candidatus Symbiobacter mobilis CR TaxID=946483 RepID=U5N3T8_9BURK|nr:GGDEF domain-containing protein [Candidatus Symbiobacter mobilis]AGX86156.1 GGDEF domain protein [Candidatus Symbiobacter mobilis CR]
MTSGPLLLEQLASLTAIRDLELMERSLLKTLYGFLRPRSLGMVRLNSKGQPTMEVAYREDRYEAFHDDLVLDEHVAMADEFLRVSDAKFYSAKTDSGVLIVFALTSTRSGRSYLQITLGKELSRMDSHMVSGVVQIYRNFVSLMHHAQTDQLTGLANRKTFDECVSRVHELIMAEPTLINPERRLPKSSSYWLVMVDIDHFKSINDRFGHLYGDEVLVILAQLMLSSFRENDLIFRFGGEEFVLIIRCADRADCLVTLERFRQRVEERSIPQVGHVTVSIGSTQMDRRTYPTTIVDRADQALYFSKRNGRNQITFFEDLLAEGLVSVQEIKTDAIAFFDPEEDEIES